MLLWIYLHLCNNVQILNVWLAYNYVFLQPILMNYQFSMACKEVFFLFFVFYIICFCTCMQFVKCIVYNVAEVQHNFLYWYYYHYSIKDSHVLSNPRCKDDNYSLSMALVSRILGSSSSSMSSLIWKQSPVTSAFMATARTFSTGNIKLVEAGNVSLIIQLAKERQYSRSCSERPLERNTLLL